jgi:two-component system response regulator DegU
VISGWVALDELVIAVIDRSEFFRFGVCQKLASAGTFRTVECPPAAEPLKFIEASGADVALLDIDSPVSNGLGVCRAIARNYPNTRVIVMSPSFSEDELFESVKAGASAYAGKSICAHDLAALIGKATSGQFPINDAVIAARGVADRVLAQFQQMAALGLVREDLAAPLSQREIQVLSQIANGGTNKSTASALGISEQTVKNHVSAILRKLNANDRAHAVALAMHNRWVTVG